MKTTKITLSDAKTMKPKYIQSEFSLAGHTVGRAAEVKYKPPKPSEMTNEELEKRFLATPSAKLKSEIMTRINNGVKFSRIKMVQYLGMIPFLKPVFHD